MIDNNHMTDKMNENKCMLKISELPEYHLNDFDSLDSASTTVKCCTCPRYQSRAYRYASVVATLTYLDCQKLPDQSGERTQHQVIDTTCDGLGTHLAINIRSPQPQP